MKMKAKRSGVNNMINSEFLVTCILLTMRRVSWKVNVFCLSVLVFMKEDVLELGEMKRELHLYFFFWKFSLNGNQLKNHHALTIMLSLDWSKLVHRAGCLSWKQISANGLATAHNCLASIRYESKAVPDIGQELSGDKNEAQDPFSGISDVVVERDY